MYLKENQEFIEKAKKSSSMSNKMKQNSQKYREFEQLALYSEADASSKDMIVTIRKQYQSKWEGKQQEKVNLNIIIGMKQPNGPKCVQKILVNLTNMMPKPSQSYSVVYVNTLASSNAYSDFKKIMQFLPIEYFQHLSKIYVLHGNFKNKASFWMTFDYLGSYLKNKTYHADTFRQLVEKIGIKKQDFLNILPEEIVFQLAKKEAFVKNLQYLKFTKENIVFNPNIYNIHEQAYIQKKPSLLPSIKLKAQSSKRKIEQYQVGQTGAPLMIQLLISYFNDKQELLNQQGLFRKSVSIDEETLLMKELSSQNYDFLENVKDPHLIANAIKRFLSNLAQPIIPYESFNRLMETQQDKFNDQLMKIVKSLKNNRKMTILLLFDFLKEKVLPRSQFNKMTQKNMSIVFGPCLMKSQMPSIQDLLNTQKSISATAMIFKDFQKIFGNANERARLIRKSVHIQGRQTLKDRFGDSAIINKLEQKYEIEQQMLETQDPVEIGKEKLQLKAFKNAKIQQQ